MARAGREAASASGSSVDRVVDQDHQRDRVRPARDKSLSQLIEVAILDPFLDERARYREHEGAAVDRVPAGARRTKR